MKFFNFFLILLNITICYSKINFKVVFISNIKILLLSYYLFIYINHIYIYRSLIDLDTNWIFFGKIQLENLLNN